MPTAGPPHNQPSQLCSDRRAVGEHRPDTVWLRGPDAGAQSANTDIHSAWNDRIVTSHRRHGFAEAETFQ